MDLSVVRFENHELLFESPVHSAQDHVNLVKPLTVYCNLDDSGSLPSMGNIPVPRPENVNEKINYALQIIRFVDKSILVQLWVPKLVEDSVYILETTLDLPFGITGINEELYSFRMSSLNKKLFVDMKKKVGIGLPSRVFLNSCPEWTPNVQNYSTTEYPQLDDAICYNVRGSLALPVFKEDCSCVGVLELVTTIEKETYDHEIKEVCRALEVVNLKSSDRRSCDCKAKIESEVSVVGLKKKRTTLSSKLTYNDLARHFRMSRRAAAERLGLKSSTFRTVCRTMKITRWPCSRGKSMKNASQLQMMERETLDRIIIQVLQNIDWEGNIDYQVSNDWNKCLINDLDPSMH